MTLTDFARRYVEMRKAQRAYFNPKTRTQSALADSMRLEHELDAEAERILNGQASLFGDDDRK